MKKSRYNQILATTGKVANIFYRELKPLTEEEIEVFYIHFGIELDGLEDEKEDKNNEKTNEA